MLTCYIIDDEEFSIKSASSDIEKMPGLQLVGFQTNPLIAIKEIQQLNPEIIFLDVEMPELSGITVAKLLPTTSAVIIRTSYVKYAQNAFDIDAIDFLFKPYPFERFVKAIKKAEDYLKKAIPSSKLLVQKGIFINSNIKGKMNQIIFSEITFIEVVDHNILIHTKSEVFNTRLSMKEIEEKLPTISFARVHRGYIVNIDLIKSFDSKLIILEDDTTIPFGEIYRQAFRDKITFRNFM